MHLHPTLRRSHTHIVPALSGFWQTAFGASTAGRSSLLAVLQSPCACMAQTLEDKFKLGNDSIDGSQLPWLSSNKPHLASHPLTSVYLQRLIQSKEVRERFADSPSKTLCIHRNLDIVHLILLIHATTVTTLMTELHPHSGRSFCVFCLFVENVWCGQHVLWRSLNSHKARATSPHVSLHVPASPAQHENCPRVMSHWGCWSL